MRDFDRALSRDSRRRIGMAMHDYDMLAEGDRVLVGVSGGVDSLILARVLFQWRRKAPIHYHLHFAHVDMSPRRTEAGPHAARLARALGKLEVPLDILPADWPVPTRGEDAGEFTCFECARNRRRLLFRHAEALGCSKLAMGHHRDDIIETFLLNLTCSGNISTMVPRQNLFSGRLAIIRPLSYLDKEDLIRLAGRLGIEGIPSPCPLAEQTRRRDMQQLAEQIYRAVPGAKQQIFSALGNVRQEYLLRKSTRPDDGQGAPCV